MIVFKDMIYLFINKHLKEIHNNEWLCSRAQKHLTTPSPEGVNIRNNSAISLIIIINRLNFLNDRATKAKFIGDNNKNLQKF